MSEDILLLVLSVLVALLFAYMANTVLFIEQIKKRNGKKDEEVAK